MAALAVALKKALRWPRRLACFGAALAAVLALACTAQAQPITPPDEPCNQISGGGTTVTCSGNLSPGVALDATGTAYTTLNVVGLNTNIAPAMDDSGVFFFSHGPVSLNVATGPFAIVTTDADGMLAAGNSSVSVNSSVAITTSGNDAAGIRVGGQNDLLTIVASGMIVTDGKFGFRHRGRQHQRRHRHSIIRIHRHARRRGAWHRRRQHRRRHQHSLDGEHQYGRR